MRARNFSNLSLIHHINAIYEKFMLNWWKFVLRKNAELLLASLATVILQNSFHRHLLMNSQIGFPFGRRPLVLKFVINKNLRNCEGGETSVKIIIWNLYFATSEWWGWSPHDIPAMAFLQGRACRLAVSSCDDSGKGLCRCRCVLS